MTGPMRWRTLSRACFSVHWGRIENTAWGSREPDSGVRKRLENTGIGALDCTDPHLLEGGQGSQDGASDPDGVLPLRGRDDLDLDGGQGSQDGASDPDGVLPLRGRDDLDLDGGRGQGRDLLLHTISDTGVHGGAAGHDGVGVQVLTDVHVALHDRVVGGLVDAAGFHAQERGLEEGLGGAEALVADGDDLAVGQLVGLLQGGGGGGCGHFLLKVQGHVAELLLDVAHDLALGGGGERVPTLGQDLHEVVGELATGQVQTEDGVGQSVTLIDGHGVGHTIAGVHHDTGGTTGGVQREHGLDGHVHGGHVEGLEHDLRHLLAIGLGVEGSLCQEDGLLLGGHTQLVVEGVMPDLLHVVPVGDDAVLHGVLQGQDTTLGLGLVAHIGVLLSHTDHHTL
ncbi:hypothetical protein TCAL_16797 [Tigriopus californicus]|uniref:Uncharacterized protein n=1 Tax=Tigriopus californicus TaxID=6832 RepID=A0A553PCN1_TIGCA|nr:hypothetical protein TCAL_16797 [Tigriopus californicus]